MVSYQIEKYGLISEVPNALNRVTYSPSKNTRPNGSGEELATSIFWYQFRLAIFAEASQRPITVRSVASNRRAIHAANFPN